MDGVVAAPAGAPPTEMEPTSLSRARTATSPASDAPSLRPRYHRDHGMDVAVTTAGGVHPPQPVATLVARSLPAAPSAVADAVVPTIGAARQSHFVLPGWCSARFRAPEESLPIVNATKSLSFIGSSTTRAEPGAPGIDWWAPGPGSRSQRDPGNRQGISRGPSCCFFTPRRRSRTDFEPRTRRVHQAMLATASCGNRPVSTCLSLC